MRAFFDPRQLAHAPALELHNGGFVPFAETPARARSVLASLGPVEPAVRMHEDRGFDSSLPVPLAALPIAAAGILSGGSVHDAQVHGTSWVLAGVALFGRVLLQLIERRRSSAVVQAPTIPPA